MNRIPSDETILHLLDHLDDVPADALESEMLDFKRWEGARKSLSGAVEAAVCFASAEGGLVVFSVKDQTKSRTNATKARKNPLGMIVSRKSVVPPKSVQRVANEPPTGAAED